MFLQKMLSNFMLMDYQTDYHLQNRIYLLVAHRVMTVTC